MQLPDSAQLLTFDKVISSIITFVFGAGGVMLFQYFSNKNKAKAEARQITANTNISTLELSDDMVREWMKTAREATFEAINLRRTVLRLENQVDNLEGILIRGLKMMKAANVEGSEAFETELTELLQTSKDFHNTQYPNS